MALGSAWNSPRVVTFRKLLMAAIVLSMVTWFAWGALRFPDSPVHLCSQTKDYLYTDHPQGYCGKQGQSRTEEDLRLFSFWEAGLSSIWFPGIILVAALGFGLPKGRKRP